ncbi:MAG: lipopolysaccharide kinase InaA family protein [Pseudomonadales bacterium]
MSGVSGQVPQALPVLGAAEVARAGRALPVPFELHLDNRDAGAAGALEADVRLRVERMLRYLPGRRLVAQARLGDRTVLLKLFVGRRARHYCLRERRGVLVLAAAGTATPQLLATLSDGACHALLFTYLEGVRALTDAPADICAAARQLARLHRAGARQRDLHLDNFLCAVDGTVHLIDGDGVRAGAGRGLSVAASLRDLGVLCAQCPPRFDDHLEQILRCYRDERGLFPVAPQALLQATRRQRRLRVRHYLRKAQRDCTEYHCEQDLRHFFVCMRECLDPALHRFAADPEAALASAEVVKAGNSATVLRAAFGTRRYVVKRYNVKGPVHRLRRALKPRSRFRLAWCNGQRLHFLGIATARPVALLERRFGPLRGVAYLVMEDRGDLDLAGAVAAAAPAVVARLMTSCAALFGDLARAGLRHGDGKASNFLVDGEQVLCIDLDAMAEDSGRGLMRDLQRFLANWPADGSTRAGFDAALREAGLPLPGPGVPAAARR